MKVVYFCICLTLLAWGFAMGRYEAWPFRELQWVKLYFFPYKPDFVLPLDVNTYFEMRREHLEMLGTRAEVVMLGDSLSELGEWQEMFPNLIIANRGIASDTTQGMLERVPTVLAMEPKRVFLLGGINDFWWGGVEVEQAAANLQQIVERLRAAGVAVVVQSVILPGKNLGDEVRGKVRDLNKKLEAMAAESGCEYLDLNETLAPEGYLNLDFTRDGVHLNGRAYKAWAERVAPLMKSGG
jgi:lysophospholipase L1-like esterase